MRRCAVTFLVLLVVTAAANADTIQWSGFEWTVRDDTGGPGPNTFLPRNVFVDADGALHLKITKVGKRWTCAEIVSTRHFDYGTYAFTVESRVDRLDPKVVFGMFSYPDREPDGTNELDIEYARWGIPTGPNLSYTAYPLSKHHEQVSKAFPVKLSTPATLNQYVWTPGLVKFESLSDSGEAAHSVFAHWQTPDSFAAQVSHISMPVHLNLWLFESPAPSDQQPVEIVVKRFVFTPAK